MIAKYKKNIMVRRLITIAAVVVSALLQTYVIQAFIRPANLLSSGFTGVAILIDRIASLYGHNISTSLGMLVLNIPVAFLCSKSISMRFTFYSMLQVFLASFFLKVCHMLAIAEFGTRADADHQRLRLGKRLIGREPVVHASASRQASRTNPRKSLKRTA